MSSISLLKAQHGEIVMIIKDIELLTAQNLAGNAKDIAYSINTLSGKLKMHLMSEDQFLYPHLMKSESKEICEIAHDFNSEMGGLADALAAFVQKYNTSSKILQGSDTFAADSKSVFRQVVNRIHREDNRLYPLLEK